MGFIGCVLTFPEGTQSDGGEGTTLCHEPTFYSFYVRFKLKDEITSLLAHNTFIIILSYSVSM